MSETDLPDIVMEPNQNRVWASAQTLRMLFLAIGDQTELLDPETAAAILVEMESVVGGIESLILHLAGPQGKQIRQAFVGSSPAPDTDLLDVNYSFPTLDTPAGDASLKACPPR